MADTEDEFTVPKNIVGVKLKARATGELMSKTLNLEATLKKATFINGKLIPASNSGSSTTGGNQGGGSSTGSDTGGQGDDDGKN